MTPVRLIAPAKLTTSLRIVGVRADGLHLIEAEMVSLDLADELEVSESATIEVVHRSADGDEFEAGPDDLVAAALRSVGRRARVVVTKRIAPGAGLGGGSADAAAVLRWAGATDLDAAARIGADVAFCVVGGRALVSGIGEVVEPLPHVDRQFTLLTPPIHCSTPAVYREWDRLGGPQGEEGNDLEPAALAVAPELAHWRDELARATGRRPRLAGSGSTWFVEGNHPGPGRVVTRTVPPVV
ncbi:MAG: 4-(cytidine 5'-diphospho)-2-C-methyl-D-erythritol kinase [Acidimicrobiia bacterium]|nr:4-(cytidine 5'-diphospho)-2-C-methyl-D-erythritol kinase [Acidimicrobiia bacterium]